MWRRWNPDTLLVGLRNAAATLQKQLLFIQITELQCDPAIPSLSRYPRELKTYPQKTYVQEKLVHIITPNWKQFKYPSMWQIHAIECYSFIRRNEVLIHTATWVNFENILWKKRDTKGHIPCDFISIKYPWWAHSERQNRLVLARGWVLGGQWSICKWGWSFLGGKNTF